MYFSWKPDPYAKAVDAMQQEWPKVETLYDFITPGQKSLARSNVKSTSFDKKQNTFLSGLDSFRESLALQGISKTASNLIVSSRRDSANANYSSAWNKWVSWCGERQVDPFRCNVNKILDYLACMFEKGYEYSTICSHRSAISAFHEKVEGFIVGDHPQMSSLISGVFVKRQASST